MQDNLRMRDIQKYFGYCFLLLSAILFSDAISADNLSQHDSTIIISGCDEIDNMVIDNDSGIKKLHEYKLKLADKSCLTCNARVYRSIGLYYQRNRYIDSSALYYKKSYSLYLDLGDTLSGLQVVKSITGLFSENYNYHDVVVFSMIGIELSSASGHDKLKADFYHSMGIAYDKLGKPKKSADALITSLSIYTAINDSLGLSLSLKALGIIFTYDQNYSDARDYTLRALDISRDIDNKELMSACYNNLGYIYAKQNQHSKALEYYTESLKIDREINDRNGIAIGLNNIGDTYKNLGDTVLAMSYYSQSLEIASPDNYPLVAIIYNNQAEIEMGRGNLRLALNYALTGLENAHESGASDVILSLYEVLRKVNAEMGRYEDAYYYLNKYRVLYDSLFSLSKTKAIHELKAKYNDELQKSEISDLKQKSSDETELRQYLLFAIIAISILIISMFIINSIIRVSRRKLKVQKKYYENLLEFSEDFIFVVDKNGATKYISPNYERKIGRVVSERIGKSAFEFIHPDDFDMVKNLFSELVKDKKPRSIDFRMRTSYEEWITVHAFGQNFINDPVINGVIVNFWDITPIKQKEELITQSELRFREIFNAFPDIYFQTDKKGYITEISPSVKDLLGYSREELLGVGPNEYHHFIEDWRKIIGRYKSNNSIYDHDTNIRTKDGRIMHCSFSAEFSYDDSGKTTGIKGVVRDISLRIKNHQKLQESQKKLKEANKSKEKILSIIAHDLIGPIGTNKSIVDLIVSQVDELTHEEVVTLITSLKPSLDSTYALIENLLSWARIQQNKLKPNFENIEISRVLKLIFELVKGQAEKKLINLNLSGDDTAVVIGDPNQIDIVFRNLISNAIKFSEKGKDINVIVETNDKYAVISIEDKGIGMSKDQLKMVMSGGGIDEVRRGTDNEKGTGFGLVIISEFVKNNKGKLEVETEEGKGSTFKVSLPIAKE